MRSGSHLTLGRPLELPSSIPNIVQGVEVCLFQRADGQEGIAHRAARQVCRPSLRGERKFLPWTEVKFALSSAFPWSLGMISFTCGNCCQTLEVKDDLAGKKGKCPHCNHPLLVPAMVPGNSFGDPTLPPDPSPAADTLQRRLRTERKTPIHAGTRREQGRRSASWRRRRRQASWAGWDRTGAS